MKIFLSVIVLLGATATLAQYNYERYFERVLANAAGRLSNDAKGLVNGVVEDIRSVHENSFYLISTIINSYKKYKTSLDMLRNITEAELYKAEVKYGNLNIEHELRTDIIDIINSKVESLVGGLEILRKLHFFLMILLCP